jgi:hypothetical protein
MVFRLLQLRYQPFDFGSRACSKPLNEWRHLCVCRLHPKFRIGKIANFPFNGQTCGEALEVRHLRLHVVLRKIDPGEMFRQEG